MIRRQRPPRLLLAWGNDGRGDDGLGLALAQAVLDAGLADGPRLEVLCAMQLQVEHVLDIAGRESVLLVDASTVARRVTLDRLQPHAGGDLFSHALAPGALLRAFRRVLREDPPPTWLLSLPALDTTLGRGLGAGARRTVADGLVAVRGWLAQPAGVAEQPAAA